MVYFKLSDNMKWLISDLMFVLIIDGNDVTFFVTFHARFFFFFFFFFIDILTMFVWYRQLYFLSSKSHQILV